MAYPIYDQVDPAAGLGGLLGIDPAQLKQLMAQFAPTEDDRRAANMQALSQFGFGLLGTRKGYEWDQAGAAAQNALQARQSSLQGAQQGKSEQFKMAQGLAKYKGEQEAAQQARVADTEIGALLQGGMSDEDKYRAYYKAAEIALRTGNVPKAKQYAEMAKELKPNFSQSPQIGVDANGKPYQFVLDNQGNEKRLSAGAKPDFAEIDLGGTKQFVNKYNLPESGQSFGKTQSPDSKASTDVAWANYGLSKNADARAAASAAKGSDGPAWVNDLERGLQIDPKSGQTRPIMANGAPVGAKGASKQADQSKIALTIIDEAKGIIDKSTGSYVGAGVDQAARVFGMSTGGAEANAQLQALEGALMLNQPRMEGPQSDKDTALYKQMAAKIGDPTVPNPVKKAALAQVEKLHKKYARTAPAAQQNDPLGLR